MTYLLAVPFQPSESVRKVEKVRAIWGAVRMIVRFRGRVGERSGSLQVDRARHRVVRLVDIAFDHLGSVAVDEAEHALAAGKPQEEERIRGRRGWHPKPGARRADPEHRIRKRYVNQARACQGCQEDRVHADAVDRELFAIPDGLGADAVDLER